MPYEVMTSLADELRERAPDGVRARGRALGRRGDARRLAAACAPSRDGSGARRRELPGRRARRRAPASARARRAALEPVDLAAQDRPAFLRSSCASSLNRTTSTRRSSTARQQATRSSSSRRSPRKPMEIPDTVRDAVLARAARLSLRRKTFLEARRGRAAARRGLAPGGARRPSRRECRRMSRVGHADG